MQLDTDIILKSLGVIVASGVGVSLVAQLLKKQLKLQANAVIHTVVVVLASLAAFAQYFQQIHSQLPPVVLGISTTAIYGISQIVFKYASYGSTFASNVSAYNQGQKAKQSVVDNSQYSYTSGVFTPTPSGTATIAVAPQTEQSQGFEL
jgi:deferrochelatase/peroxidase EfeB